MTDETGQEAGDDLAKSLGAIEYHGWKCFEEAESVREKLAALKAITDLVLLQLRLKKDAVQKEDTESVEFYVEQLRRLGERVRQLAARRRGA